MSILVILEQEKGKEAIIQPLSVVLVLITSFFSHPLSVKPYCVFFFDPSERRERERGRKEVGRNVR